MASCSWCRQVRRTACAGTITTPLAQRRSGTLCVVVCRRLSLGSPATALSLQALTDLGVCGGCHGRVYGMAQEGMHPLVSTRTAGVVTDLDGPLDEAARGGHEAADQHHHMAMDVVGVDLLPPDLHSKLAAHRHEARGTTRLGQGRGRVNSIG
jgi:hypothetical protein